MYWGGSISDIGGANDCGGSDIVMMILLILVWVLLVGLVVVVLMVLGQCFCGIGGDIGGF